MTAVGATREGLSDCGALHYPGLAVAWLRRSPVTRDSALNCHMTIYPEVIYCRQSCKRLLEDND
jgi:hypothetical protein